MTVWIVAIKETGLQIKEILKIADNALSNKIERIAAIKKYWN